MGVDPIFPIIIFIPVLIVAVIVTFVVVQYRYFSKVKRGLVAYFCERCLSVKRAGVKKVECRECHRDGCSDGSCAHSADFGHAEGFLGLKARGSSVHAEAHRSEATLSYL